MSELIETILLVLTYTILVVTIFICSICYYKKIEKIETIAFITSLFFLILSITVNHFFSQESPIKTTSIYTLIAMNLVALTTPLNALAERKHRVPKYVKTILYASFTVSLLLTLIGYFLSLKDYLEHLVVSFLTISIVFSMVLILTTKPQKHIKHLEKSERIFSIASLVIVPISLYINYYLEEKGVLLNVGFFLPVLFILLALDKLYDNLKRLSLIKTDLPIKEQYFKSYNISPREKEIAVLLITGKTYKTIAEELYISMPTVKTHTSNIYKKCGVKNKHELMMLFADKS